MIFAEHQKLSKTVPLLEQQISNLEIINKSWEHTDSIRKLQFLYYEKVVNDKNKSIDGLKKSLRIQKAVSYGVAGSCVVLLLCLLMK